MPVSASPKGNYTVTGTIQPLPLASRKGTLPKWNMIHLLGGSLPNGELHGNREQPHNPDADLPQGNFSHVGRIG